MIELLAGTGLAIIAFLFIIGINITPLLFIIFILSGFYFFFTQQGQLKKSKIGSELSSKRDMDFEDIGGQDTAINELKEALSFIIEEELINNLGIRPIKGVLMVGPPGTGKTLMARAAAGYTKSTFLAVSGSEFIEVYAGRGASRIRELFTNARKMAAKQNKKSAIIFIDELEILGAKRGNMNSHIEYEQTLNQLLVEMDGISPNRQPRILIIGASNRADMLDPALLRPGRFDRQVQVGLPDRNGRLKILEIHTQNKAVDEDVDLDTLSRASFGFSGAHLESLCNEAAILALREKSNTIRHYHFNEAIDKVMMGERIDKTPNRHEKERVSVHESGHALVSELTDKDSVSSLSIIPRGRALGFMRRSPRDDQYLYTSQEMKQQIMVAMAGALAEEIKLDGRSTGARNDFEQAWKISQDMVECGLSSLGVVKTESLSADLLFKECKAIIQEAEEKSRALLQENSYVLEELARVLLIEEKIGRQDFEDIVYSKEQKTAV